MKLRPVVHAVAVAVAGLTLAACGGSASSQVQAGTEFPAVALAGEVGLVEQLAAGPQAVPHSGVRRIELFEYDEQGNVETVAYREAVAVGDQGGFQLEPLAATTPVFPDESTFLALQSARAGYHFRYRDFRIRDLGLFLENFTLEVDTETTLAFLGRNCLHAHVRPQHDDGGLEYELLVDEATGLVLASQTTEAATGRLVQRCAYLSFSEGEPAGFEPRVPTNAEQPVDPTAPFVGQIGVDAPLPSYLPAHYALADAATVVDARGGRWLLLICSDGVEPLFVLSELPQEAQPGQLFASSAPSGLGEPTGDRLVGFRAGRFSVVQGRIGGRSLAAVGSVSPTQLQLALESLID